MLIFSSFSVGQNLRRKMQWGIWPKPVDAAAQERLSAPGSEGILVAQVFPGVTAEALGILEDDILLEINGVPLTEPRILGHPELQLRAGDPLSVKLLRKGKTKTLKGNAVGKPYESYDYADVTYGEIPFQGGFLRTIVTKPKNVTNPPGIFFVPGYTCASYDMMPEFHPYRKIIEGFTKLGYAVYRVEKPGMGDCEGTPGCEDIDYYTEQKAFEAGYEDFLTLDFTDKSNLFIFGHSMGGLQGPMLAQKYKPKGIWVYGTAPVSWHEYILNMLRFQNPRNGVDYTQHDAEMRLYTEMMYDHYVEKKSVKEAANTPEKVALMKRDFWWDGETQIFGRHYKFMQDLQDLHLGAVWADLDCHVLSMFGEADFEAINPDSHQEIARIVNASHPGKGEYVLLEGTNHSFIKVGSMEDGVRIQNAGEMGKYMRTSFNDEVIDIVHQWMQRVMKGS